MAQTLKTFVGDGSTTVYTFEFDYISKDFVEVLVDAEPVGFTLTNTYQVTLDAAPAEGTVIIIRRNTAKDRLVDFVDGSVLVAKDLNISALQAIHIAAEADNKAAGSLLIDESGAYTAGFRRIADIGDPEQSRDAVTKEWAETAMSSQLALATTKATAASVSENIAVSAANAASQSEIEAGLSEDAALSSATAAQSAAANAAQSEANAASSETAASQSETNAAQSEAAAAQSAIDADASAVAATASVASLSISSEAEAREGSDNTKFMTPLRTSQLVDEKTGWKYSRADEVVASTSAFHDFGVDPAATDIEVICNAVSVDTADDDIIVQVGDGVGSPGVLVSGYESVSNRLTGGAGDGTSQTSFFHIRIPNDSKNFTGRMKINRLSPTSSYWSQDHTGRADAGDVVLGGGRIFKSGGIVQVRVGTRSGTPFDFGRLNVRYR